MKYPKRRSFSNVGMIMFSIIFIYMVFSVYTYMNRDRVQVYEVVEGGIVNEKDYTGIIFRDETTKYTDRAGYINYYVREGKRASVGTSIYSIDETGSIATFLQEHPEAGATFSEENLSDLKKRLTSFSITYQDKAFRSVYDEKYSLEALVLEYSNFNAMDNLQTLLDQSGVNFQQVTADQAGIISYAIDSYEDLDPSQVTAELFNRENYSRAITQSGKMIAKDSPVYKVVTSDNWSVVFPMTEEDMAQYGSETSLKVSFDGKDLTATGDFSTFTGSDGAAYGQLDFNKYMVQFISDRFVQFEIVTDREDGLKIPISAVTEKTFYLVPVEYLAQGGDAESTETGFLKEVYTESGTSIEFVPTTIYYSQMSIITSISKKTVILKWGIIWLSLPESMFRMRMIWKTPRGMEIPLRKLMIRHPRQHAQRTAADVFRSEQMPPWRAFITLTKATRYLSRLKSWQKMMSIIPSKRECLTDFLCMTILRWMRIRLRKAL